MINDIWFTSDHHFGHRNIIKFCNRPFADIKEHDQALIDNWNSRVARNDTVFHLGDFAMNPNHGFRNIVRHLNGQIVLILGNHDDHNKKSKYKEYFANVLTYHEINISQQKIVLFHYPIFSWNAHYHGSWHLFGHVHGNMPWIPGNAMDVGVDSIAQLGDGEQEDYAPIHIEEVAGLFKEKEQLNTPFSKWQAYLESNYAHEGDPDVET